MGPVTWIDWLVHTLVRHNGYNSQVKKMQTNMNLNASYKCMNEWMHEYMRFGWWKKIVNCGDKVG